MVNFEHILNIVFIIIRVIIDIIIVVVRVTIIFEYNIYRKEFLWNKIHQQCNTSSSNPALKILETSQQNWY